MRISDFLADDKLIKGWLEQQAAALSAHDIPIRYWRHSDGRGFGLVITDADYSGEFHLMDDGTVTRRVEKHLDVLDHGTTRVTQFHELEARFQEFKSKIVRGPTA